MKTALKLHASAAAAAIALHNVKMIVAAERGKPA